MGSTALDGKGADYRSKDGDKDLNNLFDGWPIQFHNVLLFNLYDTSKRLLVIGYWLLDY